MIAITAALASLFGLSIAPAPVPEAKADTSQLKSAARPVYVCPMHAEVISDRPGLCPICQIRLGLEPTSSPQWELGFFGRAGRWPE